MRRPLNLPGWSWREDEHPSSSTFVLPTAWWHSLFSTHLIVLLSNPHSTTLMMKTMGDCQKLRGATTLPSPPECWLPHHRKQIYTSLGMVWLIPEFSQLCTTLPPPSRMWFHLPVSPGADIPPTSPHAAVKAIEPGTEQLILKHSLQLSKPLVFWEKYR